MKEINLCSLRNTSYKKIKGSTRCANNQPSLFDNSVIEHTVNDKFIVPHFAKKRKKKRKRKFTMNAYQIEAANLKAKNSQKTAPFSPVTLKKKSFSHRMANLNIKLI
jgi:hypothetical protein